MSIHSYHPAFHARSRRSGAMRLWLLVALGCVVVLGILVGALLLLTVDDWSRDLRTNFAQTDPEHPDPSLQCVVLAMNVEQAAQQVRNQAKQLKGWRELTDGDSNSNTEIKFERTTAVFRFVDDITVRLNETEEGTRVSVSSQSRVGKADLGQNPRNIRELLSPLRRQ